MSQKMSDTINKIMLSLILSGIGFVIYNQIQFSKDLAVVQTNQKAIQSNRWTLQDHMVYQVQMDVRLKDLEDCLTDCK